MNLTNIVKHKIFCQSLSEIEIDRKYCINTLNAYSFCVAKKDPEFAKVINDSDVLLPDGFSIVLASKVLANRSINKIAGWDVHLHLLSKANIKGLKVFYLGASENTLEVIKNKVNKDFPNVEVASYSPPYKKIFTKEDDDKIINEVNAFSPDILFVGMTAPKQEKWANKHKNKLNTVVICAIGAVFDFYAGTVVRAPKWIINLGLEWLYRLFKEPKRMWRRYLFGNTKYLYFLFSEKLQSYFKKTDYS